MFKLTHYFAQCEDKAIQLNRKVEQYILAQNHHASLLTPTESEHTANYHHSSNKLNIGGLENL